MYVYKYMLVQSEKCTLFLKELIVCYFLKREKPLI